MNYKQLILEKLNQAIKLRPRKIDSDLPDIQDFPGVPSWHDYETKIWAIGEDIRQILLSNIELRKDQEINSLLTEFCVDKRSKRGRQSFLMCIDHVNAKTHAESIAPLITDPSVDGQVINTLLKMKASDFGHLVSLHLDNEKTWIRKLAQKYIQRHGA